MFEAIAHCDILRKEKKKRKQSGAQIEEGQKQI